MSQNREEILQEVLDTQTKFFIETLRYIDYLNESDNKEKLREVLEKAYAIVKENYEQRMAQ